MKKLKKENNLEWKENARKKKGNLNNEFKKRNQTLISISSKWYNQRIIENVPLNSNVNLKLNYDQLAQLRAEAIKFHSADYYIYDQLRLSRSKNEDFEWMKNILANGTVNDKLAVYTILIQESAVHNLRLLESLIRFVNPKGKRECMMAIDTIRDLFVGNLLIPKQKLCSFEELVNKVDSNFLLNSDSLEDSRKKFLIMTHVEDKIRSFYKRFLEQLVVCSHDTLDSLKIKSINTMFDLFVNHPEQEKFLLESLINKLGDPAPKVASSTSKLLLKILQHHPPMKILIVKEVERLIFRPKITNRTQYYCLCFLSEIIYRANVDQELANYVINIYFAIFTKCAKLGEINNKTMSVLLTGVSRAFPYSKLENEVIEKYLNTFYRLIHYVNLNTAIQTLSLIFDMVAFRESGSLTDRFYSCLYRFLLQPSLDQSNKLNILLNIVFRSMVKDPVIKRVRAFAKRLLQISLLSSTSFVIAVLMIISELLKSKDGFKIDSTDKINLDDNEDEFIHNKDNSNLHGSSWVYINNDQTKNNNDEYRMDVRNPLFSNAEYEPLWELHILKKHFHPTVQLFTQKLLNSETFEYDGDPIEDFSLKHFLDRFSFKNPKKIDELKRKSIPNKVFSRFRQLNHAQLNVNSEEYLNRKEDEVPVDELFIFKYLQQKKAIRKSSDGDSDDSDIESVTSLEFEDLLNNYEKYVGEDDVDFAKDFNTNPKSKPNSKSDNFIDDDENADFDEEFDDEEDDDLNMNDFDDDLSDEQEIVDDDSMESDDDIDNDEGDIDDDDEEEEEEYNFEKEPDFKIKKPRNAAPFSGKKGFSSITNDIFASAEQFDHLLEQNETDSDLEMDDDNRNCSKKRTGTNKSKQKRRLRERKPIKKNWKNKGKQQQQRMVKRRQKKTK